MMPVICKETGIDIYRCGCPVCAPLRRMAEAARRRRQRPVPAGETDRRVKSALMVLPPEDRE